MGRKHYIIPIFVPHEGCPHNCVFCNQSRITGESLKIAKSHESQKVDAEFVRKTIEEYLKTIDNKDATIEVSFFGGTFTAIDINKQRELLAVAKEYKDNKKIDYIRMSTRPDYIDDKILEHLKSFDSDIIELGVQSLDDEVLKSSGRGHSAEDVRRASKLIKEYGFVLGHQIMPGLPGTNFEKDINTAKESIEMKPDICRIYPSLVIKDTPMETLYERGEYIPYTLKEAVDVCKEIYSLYISNDINVIRIGLQPTENINLNGDIVAGPFHPSIRELVEGAVFNDLLKEQIEKADSDATLSLNSKDLSKLYANKKEFFNAMTKEIYPKKIKVTTDNDLNRGIFTIGYGNVCNRLSINKILKEKVKEGKK